MKLTILPGAHAPLFRTDTGDLLIANFPWHCVSEVRQSDECNKWGSLSEIGHSTKARMTLAAQLCGAVGFFTTAWAGLLVSGVLAPFIELTLSKSDAEEGCDSDSDIAENEREYIDEEEPQVDEIERERVRRIQCEVLNVAVLATGSVGMFWGYTIGAVGGTAWAVGSYAFRTQRNEGSSQATNRPQCPMMV